jgi:hypothetical protein
VFATRPSAAVDDRCCPCRSGFCAFQAAKLFN